MTLAILATDALGFDPSPAVTMPRIVGLEGPFATFAWVLHGAGDAVMMPGMIVLVLVLLRSIVRVPWIANVLLLASVAVLFAPAPDASLVVIVSAVLLFLLTRVGFLSVVSMWFVVEAMKALPLTLRPDDWTFTLSLLALASLAVVGIWAYRTAVGDRSLLEA